MTSIAPSDTAQGDSWLPSLPSLAHRHSSLEFAPQTHSLGSSKPSARTKRSGDSDVVQRVGSERMGVAQAFPSDFLSGILLSRRH